MLQVLRDEGRGTDDGGAEDEREKDDLKRMVRQIMRPRNAQYLSCRQTHRIRSAIDAITLAPSSFRVLNDVPIRGLTAPKPVGLVNPS